MRKAQKEQAQSFLHLLAQAHEKIKKTMELRDDPSAIDLLEQCQEGAIELGNMIEDSEGEGFVTVHLLEDYCELIYQVHEEISRGEIVKPAVFKKLRKLLTQIENSVKNDIKVRLEVVFLPYKASMWDSLESIYMAAAADPDCDAYVVPIPYYERNADGSFGAFHYEGDKLPSYVPVTHYDAYFMQERLPDITYIHNPYDNYNYVTSVDPRFYSSELRKYTQCLVYVPYYATAGGMSEGQAHCAAYYYADYIVIQSRKYRRYFDSSLPQEKLLPFGSPKFDRVIEICKNPPQPPEDWKDRLKGKKVYFYNTSINGMLSNTPHFLKKMEYVFRCFMGREDACLIWRPHPLLESTFDSMRKNLRPIYDDLKNFFQRNEIGIYDDTPDMTETIALCDAYIGDPGTSVTSLFGIAGKPLFILNNDLHAAPQENDIRGEIVRGFFRDGHDDWLIIQGNKLYHAPNHDYHYEYYCDLSPYAAGNYYLRAMETGGNIYVCPANAQDILLIEDRKIKRTIHLEHALLREGAFAGAWNIGEYLFLIPFRYPAVVRYHTKTDKVEYIHGAAEILTSDAGGERRIGGHCVWKQYLLLASPADNRVLMLDGLTGEGTLITPKTEDANGWLALFPDPNDEDIWLLPYTGAKIVRWNIETGEIREYKELPEGFVCKSRPLGLECDEKPFSGIAFAGNKLIVSPYWGNMFLCLDKETGQVKQWDPPFGFAEEKNGYFASGIEGVFLRKTSEQADDPFYRYFSMPDRKLYDVNPMTGEYQEIALTFDTAELRAHESGFCEISEWLQYGCLENAFNSLEDFLDGNLCGSPFDRERQIRAYEDIAANPDGTCGEKIHRYMMEHL